MNEKTINKLLIIASVGLDISTIIFICLYIFTNAKDNMYLYISLFSILLANLFNIIRINMNK